MRKLVVFNNVSVDGYFTDAHGDMSWAHAAPDPEYTAFVEGNARGDGVLLFGRRTYDMMASFWPTPQAAQAMPVVAARMNGATKVVFSRTLNRPEWGNTTLVKEAPAEAVRRMKGEPGNDLVVLGSGSVVTQLAQAGLVDEYQLVIVPVVLGGGRTLFEGVPTRLGLTLTKSRAFENGSVVVWYRPA